MIDFKPVNETIDFQPIDFQPVKTDSRDLLQKTGDVVNSVFPGKQVGQAIGTLGGLGYNAGKEALGLAPKGSTAAYDTSAPSPLQVAGDVLKGGAMVAGLKAPLAPGIFGKAAQFGTLSATSAAGEGMLKKKDPTTIAKDAFLAGVTGAAIGATFGIVGKGIDSITKRSPDALYNNALKVSQRIKTAGKSPSKFLTEEKVWGNLGTIYKAAEEGQTRESGAIASKIANTISTKGDTITIFNDVKSKAIEKLSSSIGNLYSKQEISSLVDEVPIAQLRDSANGLGLEGLNKLRSQLGSFLGDSKWLQQNPAQNTKAVRAVYGVLSDTVKSNTGTAIEFARSSKWLETLKVVKLAMDKADNKYGIGLYDVISGVGGATLGGMTGDSAGERIKNALLYGGGSIAAERMFNSSAIKTGLAQILTKLDTIPVDNAGKMSRSAVLELVNRLLGSNTNESSPQ